MAAAYNNYNDTPVLRYQKEESDLVVEIFSKYHPYLLQIRADSQEEAVRAADAIMEHITDEQFARKTSQNVNSKWSIRVHKDSDMWLTEKISRTVFTDVFYEKLTGYTQLAAENNDN